MNKRKTINTIRNKEKLKATMDIDNKIMIWSRVVQN